MPTPEYYDVFLARYTLAIQDPDTPGTRYHTGIFVVTSTHGSGVLHQVTGDVTSPGGMVYTPTSEPAPQESECFHSVEKLGVTPATRYPGDWEEVLRGIPPPPQQKAFNVRTMRTEPFKSREPLVFYEPGEERKALVKCTEWTLERALPALRAKGLIVDAE
ncbi:hypothetical protein BJX68DRAFT_240171 [Aspergillus pseudodeflectus]|uniref:Uncharacterized protein n=1 Tax=Aspergillus pseudodeflectus TaxID=176178 RepID=A0ABR4K4A5_9EURO